MGRVYSDEQVAKMKAEARAEGQATAARDYDDFAKVASDRIKELEGHVAIAKEIILALREYTTGLFRSKINDALGKIDPPASKWYGS